MNIRPGDLVRSPESCSAPMYDDPDNAMIYDCNRFGNFGQGASSRIMYGQLGIAVDVRLAGRENRPVIMVMNHRLRVGWVKAELLHHA
jgi:hypothetical protein